jgi:putative transposase
MIQIKSAWNKYKLHMKLPIKHMAIVGLRSICINHKAVLRLMGKLGIRSQARKPKLHKKLEEIGTYHRYPNVLNRDFVATQPNQKWVTDIT